MLPLGGRWCLRMQPFCGRCRGKWYDVWKGLIGQLHCSGGELSTSRMKTRQEAMKSPETSSVTDNMAVFLGGGGWGGRGGGKEGNSQKQRNGAGNTGVLAGAWECTELNLNPNLCLIWTITLWRNVFLSKYSQTPRGELTTQCCSTEIPSPKAVSVATFGHTHCSVHVHLMLMLMNVSEHAKANVQPCLCHQFMDRRFTESPFHA